MTPTEADERVARGAALYDVKGPEDWLDRIDLEALQMSSITDCVVGQVDGCYLEGTKRLLGDFDPKVNADYGFTIYGLTALGTDWVELKQAWRRLINGRRLAAASH